MNPKAASRPAQLIDQRAQITHQRRPHTVPIHVTINSPSNVLLDLEHVEEIAASPPEGR